MVQYVITPWKSRQELLLVRQQLYSCEGCPARDSTRRLAVSRISVWMQRGNCPHLVESTGILTAAILNDVTENSTWCIRAAYASSFSRFVTGLLDSCQDRRRKLSMYSVAKNVGLPATYVELRHQATHEELPPLQKLRAASLKALSWIWDHYWAQISAGGLDTGECKVYLQKLFEEGSEQSRAAMELHLDLWDFETVLHVLTEMRLDVQDSDKALQSARLLARLIERERNVHVAQDNLVGESPVHSIGELRDELAKMQEDLGDSGDEEEHLSAGEPAMAVASEKEGSWRLWEGAWVSSPIGTYR